MDGKAVVYCEKAFATTYGKTAHGLVRFSDRYSVKYIIDSNNEGIDAGFLLDGRNRGILIVKSLQEALLKAERARTHLTHFVVGIATDGGKLTPALIEAARQAAEAGLNIDSGLHEFFSDIPYVTSIADRTGSTIRDIRKSVSTGHNVFSGKINEVGAKRIAVLGTDSAVGKRTTAWKLVHALIEQNLRAEMIGTGQTAWMQGVKYGIILDSLINDFISGELEHAIWSAWQNEKMEYAIIEGQGSLMNPAYPGGYEIIAASCPNGIILQHSPVRIDYDGFPGFQIEPLELQIRALELISKTKVIAVTINHEGISAADIDDICGKIESEINLPVVDPLVHDMTELVEIVRRG